MSKGFFYNYKCVLLIDSSTEDMKTETSEKICRFCKGSYPEVSFNKVAHAIPELIGNKNIFSKCECDDCNEFFGKTLENNLANYFGVYRSLAGILGKRGIPKYSSKNLKVISNNFCRRLEINGKSDIVFVDEKEKTLTIKAPDRKYKPLLVYKAFVKMALAIIPSEYLEDFSDAYEWLLAEEKSIEIKGYANIFKVFMAGPSPFGEIKTMLLIRSNENVGIPYGIFIISFENFYFQLALPAPKKDSDKISMELFEITRNSSHEYKIVAETLSSMDNIESTDELVIKYENVEDLQELLIGIPTVIKIQE